MAPGSLLQLPVRPDWEGLRDCILRRGTPERVHTMEFSIDTEVQDVIAATYGLNTGLDLSTHAGRCERHLRVMRHLGYDYVCVGLDNLTFPMQRPSARHPGAPARAHVDRHAGPITSRQEFAEYPWPRVEDAHTRTIDWYQRHLPDDMCIIAAGDFAHFAEYLAWLPGYENLCRFLLDDRQLLQMIRDRLVAIYSAALNRMLHYDRVKFVWASDQLGYQHGPLLSPPDLRELVFPGHKEMARIAHAAGRPYLLHSRGDLATIIDDLIDWVGIDARHALEETIEDVVQVKTQGYGQRIGILGGIDVHFLCHATEAAIRERVRSTLNACHPGGGYCLGTGNHFATYIPVDNYLIMLDEARRYPG